MKICSTSPNPGFSKSPKAGPTKTKAEEHHVLDATVARIEQLFQQPHDGVTGVNGYDDLEKTAGLQPSDLDYRRRPSIDG